MTVELHAAAHDAVGKEAGDKERDIAGELEFCETLAAVALKSLAIKFGERRSRTGFTLVERDEINYHPQSGWFDEGPSKGPPPCGRGLKPPEVLLLLVFFLFLLVADVVPNNGLV